MKHLISLVKDHVTNTAEGQESGIVHEVDQTTGRRNENVAALLELGALLTGRTATVNDARAKHGAVAKLPGFGEDLNSQLTAGADDDNEGLSADSLVNTLAEGGGIGTRSGQLLSLAHQLIQDGNQIGGSLAGTCTRRSVNLSSETQSKRIVTCLGDSDHVIAHLDGRQAVTLNGSRGLITSKLNVVQHSRMETSGLKAGNGVDASRALLVDLEFSNAT